LYAEYVSVVAGRGDEPTVAVTLQQMTASRQFALHLLNVWQNDSRVSTHFTDVVI